MDSFCTVDLKGITKPNGTLEVPRRRVGSGRAIASPAILQVWTVIGLPGLTGDAGAGKGRAIRSRILSDHSRTFASTITPSEAGDFVKIVECQNAGLVSPQHFKNSFCARCYIGTRVDVQRVPGRHQSLLCRPQVTRGKKRNTHIARGSRRLPAAFRKDKGMYSCG